ncbi:MAG: choice-of-anchor X domain-containing protein [Burkholderiaceae bacterium]
MNGRRWAAAAGVAAGLAALVAWWPGDGSAGDAPAVAAPAAAPLAMATDAPAAGPRTAALAPGRQADRALWQQRLARARHTLDSYRQATRYPHESRPIAEHPDQVDPNRVIVEERPLREPGGPVVDGLTLRTTQERVFVQGDESVLFTVAAVDAEGKTLPLQVPRAFAHEGATGSRPSRVAPVTVAFADDGRNGDARAGDGVLSLRLQPARQGLAEVDGVIRVELALQSGEHPGYAYFDIIYSPVAPAAWGTGVREALEAGSLNLYLPVQVVQPGRYVVTGRIDDASGRPFALVSFNDELGAGPGEVRLQVFGKLVRDGQPAFPLSLRDVDGFLLKPDAFPDRALMPRRTGTLYRTKPYPLAAFSTAEWASAERQRYLDEYTKDVDEAEQHVRDLGPGP